MTRHCRRRVAVPLETEESLDEQRAQMDEDVERRWRDRSEDLCPGHRRQPVDVRCKVARCGEAQISREAEGHSEARMDAGRVHSNGLVKRHGLLAARAEEVPIDLPSRVASRAAGNGRQIVAPRPGLEEER